MTSHPSARPSGPRPVRADIDVFGLSHPGKVRVNNEDHFLVASLHKMMQVHQTSLSTEHPPALTSEARGYVFLVADGLGGRPGGQQASETALQAIAQYVTNAMDLYVHPDPKLEPAFLQKMRKSVELSHEVVRAEAARDAERTGMATTLTMVMVLWPRAYMIHVGDSRCYRLRNERLEQLTRDQTMAQYMVDSGALSREQVEHSRLKHVLWSALGGKQLMPDTVTTDCEWNDMMLLCTDGLAKHVSDEEIRHQMLTLSSAEEMCRHLVDLALERGGSDNVTVVVGRLRQR